ncbi:hypothetical protein SAMN04488025_11079 [Planifilum fulgidum]|uniref:Uncharacterized protein n=1 Tax=Planifilum fulgidum TaxID=201973 RepID=A0A1I2N0V4_9BACL|nr:hypothetical protein SAMN04488025_11079 [Planifilum fulgidum]
MIESWGDLFAMITARFGRVWMSPQIGNHDGNEPLFLPQLQVMFFHIPSRGTNSCGVRFPATTPLFQCFPKANKKRRRTPLAEIDFLPRSSSPFHLKLIESGSTTSVNPRGAWKVGLIKARGEQKPPIASPKFSKARSEGVHRDLVRVEGPTAPPSPPSLFTNLLEGRQGMQEGALSDEAACGLFRFRRDSGILNIGRRECWAFSIATKRHTLPRYPDRLFHRAF